MARARGERLPGAGDAMTALRLLAELGERVAEDGPAAHHPTLVALARAVEHRAPGAAAALADATAPAVARARALAVASAVIGRASARTGADAVDPAA